ncbi:MULTISPECIES: hypothetical protein [Pseudomonas]|uniref:hypothetical protein n=1 Tax=Pseudomonas TaxID=286 RepID=UPI00257F5F71|nr:MULTISPECIES: hypothetical protein [Pseudomonas]
MKEAEVQFLLDEAKKGACCELVANIRVSSVSLVGDLVWDFVADTKERARSIDATRLRINWGERQISPRIVAELQAIFLYYLKIPSWFRGKRNLKAQTVVPRAKVILRLLEKFLVANDILSLDVSLADITEADVESALIGYGGNRSELKPVLNLVFSAAAGQIIGGVMKFDAKTNLRIKEILSKPKQDVVPEDTGDGREVRWLTDEQFAEASYSSLARVKDFLLRMGLPLLNEDVYEYAPSDAIANHDMKYLFGQYVEYRAAYAGVGRKSYIEKRLRRHGTSIGEIAGYLQEVNMASQCVVGLYTGGRFSELTSLRMGCRSKADGYNVVTGKVFKTKSAADLSDESWVAIDAVIDAVEALEALAPIKGSSYLFSQNNLMTGADMDNGAEGKKGYSYSGFHVAMKKYFTKIDRGETFAGWVFNSHQFKHSLTRQMIKANLGMPYISYQLKHVYDQALSLPSEATMVYGNSAALLQSQMAGFFLSEFKKQKVEKIFSPKSVVSGGGAREFAQRRQDYFEGMMGAGFTKPEIMGELGRLTDAVFANTALGYCSGRKDDPGGSEGAPCIGQLRCNPNQCKNAVITDEHIPGWKAVRDHNMEMLNDPRFFYGKEQFEAAVAEANGVIASLTVG